MTLIEIRQINDWGTRKFLGLVMAVQLVMLGLVGLAALGIDIPVLRPLVGFVYLTFIPGLVLLRLLRMRGLGGINTIVYAVGLSLAMVMFVGLFMNTLYPSIGISRPISTLPLVATISAVVVILCIVACLRHRDATTGTRISLGDLVSPPVLLLVLLPILSALGASLVNNYNENGGLFGLIVLIVVAVALIAFNRFIPAKLYPLAVAMISLSLVWHISLIYPDLSGWDVHAEYYTQSLVLVNSAWDPSIYSNLNAMLSITILAPVYSLVLGLDTIWIFKLVYAAIFSLVPLIIFQIIRIYTNDKIAFFSVFVFMSMSFFFALTPNYARQQIAELFIVLSLLVILGRGAMSAGKAFLLIVFGASLVVSHYGASYVYLFIICIGLPVAYFLRYLTHKLGWAGGTMSSPAASPGLTVRTGELNLTYVLLLLVICFAWYMYMSSSSPLESVIRVSRHVYNSLGTMFFESETREQLTLMAIGIGKPATVSLWRFIYLYLQYAIQFFIVAGFILMVVSMKKGLVSLQYLAFTAACLFFLMLCIVLPYLASALDISRIYHLSLILLAFSCILGGIAVFRCLLRLIPLASFRKITENSSLCLLVMIVLFPYFLLSTGFVYELTGDTPTSDALSSYRMDVPALDSPGMQARSWFLDRSPVDTQIIGDKYAEACLIQLFPSQRRGGITDDIRKIPPEQYIFFRQWNIVNNSVLHFTLVGTHLFRDYVPLLGNPDFDYVLGNRSKIYDAGSAWIYGPAGGGGE